MDDAHRLLGWAALAGILSFSVLSAAAGLLGGWKGWLDGAYKAVQAVFGVQALIGLALLALGPPPAEPLHFLYAAAVIGVLAFAHKFGEEAPAKPRAWVMALGGLVATALVFRLFGTG